MRKLILLFGLVLFPLLGFPQSGAVLSIDRAGWYINANIGGANPSLGSVNVASYTSISDASLDLVIKAGSASAEIPCSGTNPSTGLTCAVGSENLGIVFTPPTAGTYEVCAEFGTNVTNTSGATSDTFQWVRTANNSQTILDEGGGRMSISNASSATVSNMPIHTCGIFVLTDTAKATFRVMYEQEVTGSGSAGIVLDRGASVGQRDAKITVRRRVEFADAIKFTNLVTTNEASGVKFYAAKILNPAGTSDASVGDQTGGWIASVANPSAGVLQIPFTGGTFAVPPTCNCTIRQVAGAASVCAINSLTASQINIQLYNQGGSSIDDAFELACYAY